MTGNAVIIQLLSVYVYLYVNIAFKAALAEADYQRREYIRVKEGKKHKTSFIFKPVWALVDVNPIPVHYYVACGLLI